MSEDNSPENGAPQNIAKTSVKIALLAGVLGLAFSAGLYAFSGGKDKTQDTLVANVETSSSGSCVFNEAVATKIDAAASGEIAGFRALDRGFSVANLAFKDKDGNPKTLGDWKGRTVLLNLWATWCPPCRAEMPYFNTLQKELGGAGFEVVAVSVDKGEDKKPKGFLKKIGVTDLGFYHDPSVATLFTLKKAGLAYGLPVTLLVGKDGCVLGVLNGPAKWASDDARRLIKTATTGL